MNYIYERKINYYETDKMGVVHHSNYIRFLEEARCSLLDSANLPYSYFEQNGIMIPVLNVNCDFKTHVTFDDTILINVFVKDCNGVKLTIGYVVTDKKTSYIVLTGETRHCFTDINIKPIRLPKFSPDIYNKFMILKKENDITS